MINKLVAQRKTMHQHMRQMMESHGVTPDSLETNTDDELRAEGPRRGHAS